MLNAALRKAKEMAAFSTEGASPLTAQLLRVPPNRLVQPPDLGPRPWREVGFAVRNERLRGLVDRIHQAHGERSWLNLLCRPDQIELLVVDD